MTRLFTMDDFRDEMTRRKELGLLKDRLTRNRRRPRIPDGKPRIVDSPKVARAKGRAESTQQFFARLVSSARARLDLFKGRKESDEMPCPWAAIFDDRRDADITVDEPTPGVLRVTQTPKCIAPCRCGGTGKVTVGFMVKHYEGVVAEFGGKR